MGLSELYLQMGRLILVFVVMLGALGLAQLLIEYGAEIAQEKIDAAVEHKRMSYRKIAKKYGRIVK